MNLLKKAQRHSDLVAAAAVVLVVAMMVIPLPAFLLDLLITLNISAALMIVVATLYVPRALDFSSFPSLLLLTTLFRLAINVSVTRLILLHGDAGHVVTAFGNFVVGGNVVVGLVIFLILIVIQFVVITNGAGRVAEVGARFTLDAMPGKQMAIDADLNAGLITDNQARDRRAAVSAEADFYGAMDGASKFVKGDAIAGLVIIIINIVGGIAIGMLQRGLDIGGAVSTYTLLTIGDGLVTQIPALLMAVSTGMIVTRSSADADLGSIASKQLTQSRVALMIAGCAAIVMAIIPGMPPIPFVLVGAFLILASQRIKASEKAQHLAQEIADASARAPETETTDVLIEEMRIHALEILLAPDLVDIVSGTSDDLLARVRALRRKIALELGIVVPPVRTRDSVDLPSGTYMIRIAGVEAGRGLAPGGKVLALGDALDTLPGAATVEPVFGLAGKWIPSELRHSAELTGATVIDRVSVLVTHLSSLITNNAARLLTREDVRVLTEGVKQVSPAAVDELVPNVLSLAEVQRVLQGLLAEQVSINDLPRIYEALSLRAKVSTDAEGLIETARQALGPAITAKYIDGAVLRVIMIDPTVEQSMLEGMRQSEFGTQIMMDQNTIEAVLNSVKESLAVVEATGQGAVLVCAPALRPAIRRLVSAQSGGLPVLSYQEVTSSNADIETVGVVRVAAITAA